MRLGRWPAVALVVTVAVGAACSSESSTDSASTIAPGIDGSTTPVPELYSAVVPPDALAGQLLGSQPVDDNAKFVGTRNVTATQFAYAVPSIDGTPVASSGMLFVPGGDVPAGGWPLVTYAHPTAGLGDKCAPSIVGAPSTDFPALLAKALGTAVVATDYRGLGTPGVHPYLVGIAAGDDVLLAARAAETLLAENSMTSRTGVPSLVIVGGSQGAHAALWAAARASLTVPEFDLVGTLAQAPPTNIAALYGSLEGLEKPLGVAAVFGSAAWDPSLDPADVLSDEALDARAMVETGCVVELFSIAAAGSDTLFANDPTVTEPWATALNALTPPPPAGPVLVQLGTNDQLIVLSVARTWIDEQCKLGASIATEVVPDAGHDGLLADPARLIAAVKAVQAGTLDTCNAA